MAEAVAALARSTVQNKRTKINRRTQSSHRKPQKKILENSGRKVVQNEIAGEVSCKLTHIPDK
jgi:hypothetical protein